MRRKDLDCKGTKRGQEEKRGDERRGRPRNNPGENRNYKERSLVPGREADMEQDEFEHTRNARTLFGKVLGFYRKKKQAEDFRFEKLELKESWEGRIKERGEIGGSCERGERDIERAWNLLLQRKMAGHQTVVDDTGCFSKNPEEIQNLSTLEG